MPKMTNTGLNFSVFAGVPATYDGPGYAGLSWVDAGELTDYPAYGPNVAVVESLAIEKGVVEKFKGFVNYGSVPLGFETDFTDPGQQVIEEGVIGSTKHVRHSYRTVYPDGTIEYYSGKNFSYDRAPGSANSMVKSTATVEIETPVVRVLPTP